MDRDCGCFPAAAPHCITTLAGFYLSVLGLLVLVLLALPPLANAASSSSAGNGYAQFDPTLFAGKKRQSIDPERFAYPETVSPGVYQLNVYLDKHWLGRMRVRFVASNQNTGAVPCLSAAMLQRMRLDPAQFDPEGAARIKKPDACVQLGELIPGARLKVDMAKLRVDAVIPQAYMNEMPRGYVNPASWDPGVTALFLDYDVNAYHTNSSGYDQTRAFLRLRSGLNLGHWQFRQESTYNWRSSHAGIPGHQDWENIRAYVRRPLPQIRSNIILGDSFTDGAVFDSFGLRGMQVATAEQMLPRSLRGYAPVVRGVADTNAVVTIRQNGVQIYQKTVPPGPFVIKDLYPTGYGGDLDVTVTEADGRQHSFSIPYASVAQLLRPGIWRYDAAVGKLRSGAIDNMPMVAQAAVQHGFSNRFTGYTGVQLSRNYEAFLAGLAFNTPIGALAFDVTQARANLPSLGTYSGQSYHLTYSKIIPSTNTTLTVAAYRFSTRGFLNLVTAETTRDYIQRGLYNQPYAAHSLLRQRSRFTLSLRQKLTRGWGSLSANISSTDYWNSNGRDTQYRVGYRNHFGPLSVGLSVAREHTRFSGYSNRVTLHLSMPLGGGAHRPYLALNVSHNGDTGMREQALLTGSAGDWNQYNYGASLTHGESNGDNSMGVHGGYRSPYAVLNATLGKGSDYWQESLGASGSVVAHSGGVTFGQPLGKTVALVHAPGAGGAHVTNSAGVRVDDSGYAVVPYLAPYRLDEVHIDPTGLPLGVQLKTNTAAVAPFKGAVVMVDFNSQKRRALIARIHRPDGGFPPYGSQVVNAKGDVLGVVGQGGLTLLRGVQQSGRLKAKWRGDQGRQRACFFRYTMPESDQDKSTYRQVRVTCRPAHGRKKSSQGDRHD